MANSARTCEYEPVSVTDKTEVKIPVTVDDCDQQLNSNESGGVLPAKCSMQSSQNTQFE